MSYICLLANEQGAAAAGDTRITISLPFGIGKIHHDHGCKVFISDSGNTVWATAGITRIGFVHYPTHVKKIMSDESLSLRRRIHLVEHYMNRATSRLALRRKLIGMPRRAAAALLKPLFFLPGIQPVRKKLLESGPKPQLFNLIYSGLDGAGIRRTGSVCVSEGRSTARSYPAVIFIENGMNMDKLMPGKLYAPTPSMPVAEMEKIARARVQESIDTDIRLKQQNPHYLATIGGKIRSAATGTGAEDS